MSLASHIFTFIFTLIFALGSSAYAEEEEPQKKLAHKCAPHFSNPSVPMKAVIIAGLDRFLEELKRATTKYTPLEDYIKGVSTGKLTPVTPGFLFPINPRLRYINEAQERGIKWDWKTLHPHGKQEPKVMPYVVFKRAIIELTLTKRTYLKLYKEDRLPLYEGYRFPSNPYKSYGNILKDLGRKFAWPKTSKSRPGNIAESPKPYLDFDIRLGFKNLSFWETKFVLNKVLKVESPRQFAELSDKVREEFSIPDHPEEPRSVSLDELLSPDLLSLAEFRAITFKKEFNGVEDYNQWFNPEVYSGLLPENPEEVYGIPWAEILKPAQ